MRQIIIILLILVLLVGCTGKTVEIDSGLIQGETQDGVETYFGIPYATPPVGDLRWQAPQLVETWKKVKKTTAFSPICLQPQEIDPNTSEQEMSEDCLYLNIWTPANQENLPVMVWIHGGAFLVGSGSLDMYNGHNLASKGVVVVTINYRLGSLGFLAHPDGLSGNYAFLDQLAALQWVQRNIEKFGGDPNKVTIFGESAGAMSTTTLMLSPLSENLFHRVIAQSGSPIINKYIFPDSPGDLQKAFKVGKQFEIALGCDSLVCMRSKTGEELLVAANSTFKLAVGGLQFGPVVDGNFLPDSPENLLSKGEFKKVPLLIGSNADEGTLFVEGESTESYHAWAEQFSTEETLPTTFSELYTQTLFTKPAKVVASSFKESPVYLYEFTHVLKTEDGELFGAFHGVEIPYVFGNLNDEYSDEDFALSEKMINYWVNFAKTGNPNSLGLEEWPVYKKILTIN